MEHAPPPASPINPTARIVIIDDHPIVRRGLAELLEDHPGLEVVGEASSLAEAIDVLRKLKPDLALLDLSLGDGHGLELIKQVEAMELGTKVLVVSMLDEALYADRVLRAGAAGYLRKDQAIEQIVPAIRRVLKNEVYLSDDATARLLRQVGQRTTNADEATENSPVSMLSDRELEVFEMLGDGQGSRQIAETLHLSVKTIETYREKIKAKLGLRNATELTKHAIHWKMRQQQP